MKRSVHPVNLLVERERRSAHLPYDTERVAKGLADNSQMLLTKIITHLVYSSEGLLVNRQFACNQGNRVNSRQLCILFASIVGY